MVILGIDPGLKGGLAVMDAATRQLKLLTAMPVIDRGGALIKRKGATVDGRALTLLLMPFVPQITVVALEDVHSMPGQGVASMFSFGEGYGIVQGVLLALGLKITKIQPSVWKSQLNLSSDKKKSLEMAARLWPEYGNIFKLAKNDGLAEAALMCKFAHGSIKIS